MRTALAGMIKRTTLFLLLLSILTLMLISFLPLVIIENVDEEGNSVFLNFESMKISDRTEIQKPLANINLINICLWTLIIVNLLSLFGVIVILSQRYNIISNLLLIPGCASIILSIFCFYTYFSFILNVSEIENISLAYIVENLNFSYIILILSFLIILGSISYIVGILPYFFKLIKTRRQAQKPIKSKKEKSKKIKPENEFENKKQVVKEWDLKEKEEIKPTVAIESKKTETDIPESKETPVEEAPKNEKPETPPDSEIHNEKKSLDFEGKKSPFSESYEDKEIQPDTSEEIKPSDTFEKALYSAIDKKRKNGDIEPKKELKDKKELKKYSVKCPECNFVFNAEKEESGITKIKCPRCGKEGVIQ